MTGSQDGPWRASGVYLRTVLHGIGVIHGVVHYENTVEERKCINCCQKALTAERPLLLLMQPQRSWLSV